MQTFVDRLISERKRRKIRQKNLEQKAGLTATALSRIEKGERDITLREAQALADALDMDLNSMTGYAAPKCPDIFAALDSVPTIWHRQVLEFLRQLLEEAERRRKK